MSRSWPIRLRKGELFRVLYVGSSRGTVDGQGRNVHCTGRRLGELHRTAWQCWVENYGATERIESVHVKIVTLDQVMAEGR